MRPITVSLLLLAPVILSVPSAVAECTAPREETVAVGGTFIWTSGDVTEWWSNSNGVPGLQRFAGDCYAADHRNFQFCLDPRGYCVL